jgi:hypothetical protein
MSGGRINVRGKNLIGVCFGVLLCLGFDADVSRRKTAIPAEGEKTVKTVKNPAHPLYGDQAFDLESWDAA